MTTDRLIEVRIQERDADGAFSPTLAELLRMIAPFGETRRWYLCDLEATGDLSSLGTNMLAMESRISGSDHALSLSWADLVALADRLDQVINILLAACVKAPARATSFEDLFRKCDCVVEAVDTDYWRIACPAEALDLLRARVPLRR